MNDLGQPDPRDASEVVLSRNARVLAAGTLAMVIVSWPLWVGDQRFPRVLPFLPKERDLEGPAWLAWSRMVLVVCGLAWMVLGPQVERLRDLRRAASIVGLMLIWSILADIERLQPWIQQAVLACLAIATLPTGLAVRFLRWSIISIYFFSGLSKLDASFVSYMGPVFVNALVGPLGFDVSVWQEWHRNLAVLSMPAGELVTSLLLIRPTTRRLGVAGATLMHSLLIAMLGPWNLDHSGNVLIWNLSLLVEVRLLFSTELPALVRPPPTAWPGTALLSLALVAPALEPYGWIDPWPAHALYASHVGRVRIYFGDGVEQVPPWLRTTVDAAGDETYSINLTRWSREVRGVPTYPGVWANLAIAAWLAPKLAPDGWVRVDVFTPATRWRGARQRLSFHGVDEITRASDGIVTR